MDEQHMYSLEEHNASPQELVQLVSAKKFAPNKAGVNSQEFHHLELSTDPLLCMHQLGP